MRTGANGWRLVLMAVAMWLVCVLCIVGAVLAYDAA